MSNKSTQLNVSQADVTSINLSDEQAEVFKLIENTNETLYVTGKAGTGKSILLQYFVEHTKKRVVVVAPTGVAALNVGGQTIHSFFKLAPELQDLETLEVDGRTKELLKNIDTIVIDEVSMVRADLMEAINIKMQLALKNKLPFGGIQMVMFGDLYQLPPVVSDNELRSYFEEEYGGIYFFNAHVFKETKLRIVELSYIFRQKSERFRRLLNAIRNGEHDYDILEELNERVVAARPESGFITLAGNNATVSKINHSKLESLTGEERVYEASVVGDMKENNFPTEKGLKLKVGAQVMLLKNDTERPRRWVNGTLGIVTKLKENEVLVNIDGVEHTVEKESWEAIKYSYDTDEKKLKKQVTSAFVQIPLRLAWAITIHKSQGQTYSSVVIDTKGGMFQSGQTYVALSRCTSLEGLYLTAPIRDRDIIIDRKVVEFMGRVKG